MIDKNCRRYEPFFGKWKIDGDNPLGAGSFGQVYRIYWEDGLGEKTFSALKYIHIPREEALRQQLSEQRDTKAVRRYFQSQVERIKQEIEILKRCRGQSNIVSYEDHMIIENAGENKVGWDILIRMELLNPLSFFSDSDATQYDVLSLWSDISNALMYCEQPRLQIIHRDIKPDNIMISQNGQYKLSDFGVARQVLMGDDAGTRVGTESYMAPEVFRGHDYDKRADYYSLGRVVYYFLNHNRHAFMPPYPKPYDVMDREKASRIRNSGRPIPPLPNVSPEINRLLLRALAYRPQDRFASAREMHAAVEAVLEQQGEQLKRLRLYGGADRSPRKGSSVGGSDVSRRTDAEAERKASEERARIEAERKASEERARIEAERRAAEERSRIEAERRAAEERSRIEAERKAAEERSRSEAEKKEAERARVEAERRAAEERARAKAEKKEAEGSRRSGKAVIITAAAVLTGLAGVYVLSSRGVINIAGTVQERAAGQDTEQDEGETIQLYSVSYEFEAEDGVTTLPKEVMKLLPEDRNLYGSGEEVAAVTPSSYEVSAVRGSWTFLGYDTSAKSMIEGGITFTGRWAYEAPSFFVTYSFTVSENENETLPDEVLVLLPDADREYKVGETVTPQMPARTAVRTEDGTWTFSGYDADSREMVDGGISFTGTWTYAEDPKYGVTFRFVSTSEKELPEEVTALLPAFTVTFKSGESVTAPDPEATVIAAEEGVWTFEGYEKDTLTVEDQDLVFTGSWSFEEYERYGVDYRFESATEGKKLPSAVTALQPVEEESFISGETVSALVPEETSVTVSDGTWTFEGYESDSLVVQDDVVVFTGRWSFTEAERYSVSYSYVSGTSKMKLPKQVAETVPEDANTYYAGRSVTAVKPSQTSVATETGTWNFVGYDTETKEMTEGGITFIGEWKFTEYPRYEVSYEFVSGTEGYTLPEEVLALIPVDENEYIEGTEAEALSPAETVIAVDSDLWSFAGYEEDSLTVSARTNVFTGVWERSANPTETEVGEIVGSVRGSELTLKGWVMTAYEEEPTFTTEIVSADGAYTLVSEEAASEMSASELSSKSEKYKEQIAAAAGYVIRDRLDVEDLPRGEYRLVLKCGEAEVAETAVMVGDDGTTDLSKEDISGIGSENTVYVAEDKSFSVGLDADGKEIHANASQVILSGWINADAGTSIGAFITLDGELLAPDTLAESGGSLTVTRAARYLQNIPASTLGLDAKDANQAGVVVDMNLPGIADGTHTLNLTLNVVTADGTVQLVDFMELTLITDASEATDSAAVEKLTEGWKSEFPAVTPAADSVTSDVTAG